ncbi:hypothetical protein H3146_27490, partial [Streptomyces sp. OF3]|nr:hypothetical protein [Streptomyces alkaliterrae]
MPWPVRVRESGGGRLATSVVEGALDALHPLIVVGRGLRRLAGLVRRWWEGAPQDRRGPAAFLAVAVALLVWMVPYGPWLAAAAVMAVAAVLGRTGAAVEEDEEPSGPSEEEAARLQALYDALAPCFCAEDDPHPEPLYAPDGSWERAFVSHGFGEDGRLESLELRYPPYFADGDPSARRRVQQVLGAKAGRYREYHFAWDQEANRLRLSVLGALPTGVRAQRFVAAPGEVVLGFTDPESVQRTLPVGAGEEFRDVPPVVWRTGPRSTEPHLLALGQPGSGTTTLLRSVALQALERGEVLVLDGSG